MRTLPTPPPTPLVLQVDVERPVDPALVSSALHAAPGQEIDVVLLTPPEPWALDAAEVARRRARVSAQREARLAELLPVLGLPRCWVRETPTLAGR